VIQIGEAQVLTTVQLLPTYRATKGGDTSTSEAQNNKGHEKHEMWSEHLANLSAVC